MTIKKDGGKEILGGIFLFIHYYRPINRNCSSKSCPPPPVIVCRFIEDIASKVSTAMLKKIFKYMNIKLQFLPVGLLKSASTAASIAANRPQQSVECHLLMGSSGCRNCQRRWGITTIGRLLLILMMGCRCQHLLLSLLLWMMAIDDLSSGHFRDWRTLIEKEALRNEWIFLWAVLKMRKDYKFKGWSLNSQTNIPNWIEEALNGI